MFPCYLFKTLKWKRQVVNFFMIALESNSQVVARQMRLVNLVIAFSPLRNYSSPDSPRDKLVESTMRSTTNPLPSQPLAFFFPFYSIKQIIFLLESSSPGRPQFTRRISRRT